MLFTCINCEKIEKNSLAEEVVVTQAAPLIDVTDANRDLVNINQCIQLSTAVSL